MDYAFVIFSPMLSFPMFVLLPLSVRAARSALLSPRRALRFFSSHLFPIDCRLFARSLTLLPLFLDVVLFVFSSLQPLFAKTGGYGVPP
jgi:hypothetical protein